MSWRGKGRYLRKLVLLQDFQANGVGFPIASIHWKPGAHDFSVSFSKTYEGFKCCASQT
jgi:hypothetical protein